MDGALETGGIGAQICGRGKVEAMSAKEYAPHNGGSYMSTKLKFLVICRYMNFVLQLKTFFFSCS